MFGWLRLLKNESIVMSNVLLIVGALIGAVLAIRGAVRPFLGLLVLMTLHFIQPGELIPALTPFRIELVYGILMIVILMFSRATVLKKLLLHDPIVRATILLEGVILLTIPFAIWRGGAFEAATELLKMIILQLLMTVFIDTQDRLRAILWLLSGFMVWFAGSALLAYTRGEFYEINGVQRAEGINSMVGGPNELAGLLLALLPFAIALIRCNKKIWMKLLLAGCAVLGLFVLLLTGARISLLALVAVALYAILRSKRKILNLSAAVALALIVWFSLSPQYQERYLTMSQYARGGQLDDSNKLRLAIWDAGWRMFLDHPILGVGAGQFPTAYGTIYSGKLHTAWMNPHNLLLQVTCELGLLGLGAFVYFLYQIWKANRWVIIQTGSLSLPLNHQFAVACSFMMLGIGVISSVSHTLYRPYWYLLAGLVAANRALTSQTLQQESPISKVERKVHEKLPKAGPPMGELQPVSYKTHRRKKKTRYF
jgi:putative inorganic carbon (hco3(-)) transporter